jgi:hypothetical protein
MALNCKHDGCHCEIPSSRTDEHCSDHCAQHSALAAHVRHECKCGHAGCRPSVRAPASAESL